MEENGGLGGVAVAAVGLLPGRMRKVHRRRLADCLPKLGGPGVNGKLVRQS
jgi:hypothetical protein